MTSRDQRAHRIRPSGPPQPRPHGRWHKLFVVPPGGEHRVTALGDKVAWVWRHYLPAQKRFELCLDSIGGACLLCQRHYARDQSGYLAVLRGGQQETMVVTSSAWLNSPSLQRADGKLRGYLIHCVRLQPRPNGPLRLWVPGDCLDSRRLPREWDVLAELDVRYGLAQRDPSDEGEEPGRAAQ